MRPAGGLLLEVQTSFTYTHTCIYICVCVWIYICVCVCESPASLHPCPMSEVLWCLTGALLMAPRRAVPRISEKTGSTGPFCTFSHAARGRGGGGAALGTTLLSRTRAGRRAFQSSSFRGCGQRGPFFVGRIHQFIHWSMHPRIGSMLSGVFSHIFRCLFTPQNSSQWWSAWQSEVRILFRRRYSPINLHGSKLWLECLCALTRY